MKFMDSLGTAARRVVVIDDNVAANGAQCVRQSLFTQSLQFTDDIVSMLLSFFFNSDEIFSAKILGDVLLIFERTIATLVEISQSNFRGGTSVFIPLNVLGIITSFFLLKSTKIDLILPKYKSKIFIYSYYIN